MQLVSMLGCMASRHHSASTVPNPPVKIKKTGPPDWNSRDFLQKHHMCYISFCSGQSSTAVRFCRDSRLTVLSIANLVSQRDRHPWGASDAFWYVDVLKRLYRLLVYLLNTTRHMPCSWVLSPRPDSLLIHHRVEDSSPLFQANMPVHLVLVPSL